MDSEDSGLNFGCIIPEELAPAIEFSNILSEDFVGVTSAGPTLSIPKVADHFKPHPVWNPLNNDKYNVCNAIVWSNTRRMVTSKLTEQEVYPSQEQVYAFYKTQNPNFNPEVRDRVADRGMLIQTSLEHLVKEGGPDGQRALAFARVDPKNVEDVRLALATFGSIWLGIKVYPSNKRQFQNGQEWKLPTLKDKGLAGGHAVVAGAYDPNFKIITWGKVASLSDEYWNGHMEGENMANVFEAYVVVWPEHIGTRRFMSGVSLQQLADQFYKMTGKDMEIPTAQFNSLFRCQTVGGDGVSVTLQKIDAATSYSSVPPSITIKIDLGDASNGTFVVESNDLYFIKTKNTASNMVEVRRVQDPAYNKVELWVTNFDIVDAAHGRWTIDNGDLYFIKTAETASGMIELFRAFHQSGFKKSEWYTSVMKVENVGSGTYAVSGGDLFQILDADNSSGFVELTCAKSYPDDEYGAYERLMHETTAFKINDVKGSGTWSMGQNGDLFLIKTNGTESGLVELHTATASSNYYDQAHYSTGFQADQTGVWMIY